MLVSECMINILSGNMIIHSFSVVFIYTTELNAGEKMEEGSIVLSNGNFTAGVLQVFYKDSWIDVCANISTGHVACRQLGFYSVLGVFDDLAAIG